MIIQILAVLTILASCLFIEIKESAQITIKKELKTVSFLPDYNNEPSQESKPFRYFDLSTTTTNTDSSEVFTKVSSLDLEGIIGQYAQNEPHCFILKMPNGEIELKHILFSRYQIWNFPFARLLFDKTISKCIYIQTTKLKNHDDLKNLSESELLKSEKILWINALYFFTGNSYFSNDLITLKDGKSSHNSLKDADKSKDLDFILPTMRAVLWKTVLFKGKTMSLSPLTNVLPVELIEHIKQRFPSKKSISEFNKKRATEFYSWICDHAAEALGKTITTQ